MWFESMPISCFNVQSSALDDASAAASGLECQEAGTWQQQMMEPMETDRLNSCIKVKGRHSLLDRCLWKTRDETEATEGTRQHDKR
jgi:hypothetical protein